MMNTPVSPVQPLQQIGPQPEPGGGSGGSGSGLTSYDFGHQPVGGPAVTARFQLYNGTNHPGTLASVKLTSATPERWSADFSKLVGTLQPGATLPWSITFTPPAS